MTDEDVELRVTLSYFAEPNRYRRTMFYGMGLRWDMQGPQESEEAFHDRINKACRPVVDESRKRKRRFDSTGWNEWEVGPQRRGRGTVQSDRLRVRGAQLAGHKLVAVYSTVGWWDGRKDLKFKATRFSLLVTVIAPGIYEAIRSRLAVPIRQEVLV